MGQRGTLTPERFGYSTPIDAPLYPRPPWHYRDAQFVVVTYETDPDAAARALPADLALTSPAVAQVTVAHYPSTPVGPYTEAIQQIQCEWAGQRRSYISKILLDNDGAIAAGREIFGFPKKFAFVELRREGDALTGTLERPRGHRLLTVTITLAERLELPSQPQAGAVVSLRLIPNIEENKRPSVMELTEVTISSNIKEAWAGQGSLEFGPPSEADPWSALPVRKLLTAHYTAFDFELPLGRVLKRY
jgi:acetoacetate decarboxylase